MTDWTVRQGTGGRWYTVETDGRKSTVIGTFRSAEEADELATGLWSQAADIAAELATERWYEERGGSTYAGSEEEARDRWFDSLRDEALEGAA